MNDSLSPSLSLSLFERMGNCISSPEHVEPVHHIDSAPAPSTNTGPVVPQTQPQIPIPEPEAVGVTPEHIADREGVVNSFRLLLCKSSSFFLFFLH